MTGVELQHGGAFVIVRDINACCDLINIKHKATTISLGQSAAEFFRACNRIKTVTEFDAFRQAALDWMRNKRFLQAELAAGTLSAIDGCVVLDRLSKSPRVRRAYRCKESQGAPGYEGVCRFQNKDAST